MKTVIKLYFIFIDNYTVESESHPNCGASNIYKIQQAHLYVILCRTHHVGNPYKQHKHFVDATLRWFQGINGYIWIEMLENIFENLL